jgi:nucleotide-binding universal stress UspA family protein
MAAHLSSFLGDLALNSRPLRAVVATNGDEDSKGAVELAARLTEHRDAVVMAVTVVGPSEHSAFQPHLSGTPIDNEALYDVPDAVVQRLEMIPASNRWTKRAYRGWPADVINSAAANWDASLIVLGLGRHQTIDRLFGTETAINVMKHASLPVLAVPAATRELPRRACAAIDFTPASMAAAVLAASLLGDNGKLTLLHASPFAGAEMNTDPVAQLYRDAAGKRLAEVLAVVRRKTTHQVNGLMLDGEPTDTIVDFVRSEQCDLIALGGHPQGLVDRILIGSVRTRVLRAVSCSVLVSPPEPERA